MTSQSPEHTLTSREFFAKAEGALVQDGLLQASENGWGAAAHMVKAIAGGRGWQHSGHRELYQAADRLAEGTGDPEIRVLFDSASALHSNFYEGWMPREMIASSLAKAGLFLRKLEGHS